MPDTYTCFPNVDNTDLPRKPPVTILKRSRGLDRTIDAPIYGVLPKPSHMMM